MALAQDGALSVSQAYALFVSAWGHQQGRVRNATRGRRGFVNVNGFAI